MKTSVHYALVDGGALTAPDNAVFDPINNQWIAENKGIPKDIEVHIDAISVANQRKPQLDRAAHEALRLLEQQETPNVTPQKFTTPADPAVY